MATLLELVFSLDLGSIRIHVVVVCTGNGVLYLRPCSIFAHSMYETVACPTYIIDSASVQFMFDVLPGEARTVESSIETRSHTSYEAHTAPEWQPKVNTRRHHDLYTCTLWLAAMASVVSSTEIV